MHPSQHTLCHQNKHGRVEREHGDRSSQGDISENVYVRTVLTIHFIGSRRSGLDVMCKHPAIFDYIMSTSHNTERHHIKTNNYQANSYQQIHCFIIRKTQTGNLISDINLPWLQHCCCTGYTQWTFYNLLAITYTGILLHTRVTDANTDDVITYDKSYWYTWSSR